MKREFIPVGEEDPNIAEAVAASAAVNDLRTWGMMVEGERGGAPGIMEEDAPGMAGDGAAGGE